MNVATITMGNPSLVAMCSIQDLLKCCLKKRFLPCSESMCVSVIANDRSESSLMSTKPVCITSCQLIKIRLVLFLKKKREENRLGFKIQREIRHVLALVVAELFCRVWKRKFFFNYYENIVNAMSTCKSVMYICDVSVFLTTTIRAVVSLPAFQV